MCWYGSIFHASSLINCLQNLNRTSPAQGHNHAGELAAAGAGAAGGALFAASRPRHEPQQATQLTAQGHPIQVLHSCFLDVNSSRKGSRPSSLSETTPEWICCDAIQG